MKSVKQSNFYLRPHKKALLKKEGSLEMSKCSEKRDFLMIKEWIQIKCQGHFQNGLHTWSSKRRSIHVCALDALSKSPRNKLRYSRRSWKCTSIIEVEKKIVINQSIFGSYRVNIFFRRPWECEGKQRGVVWERGLEVNKHCNHTYHINLNSPNRI